MVVAAAAHAVTAQVIDTNACTFWFPDVAQQFDLSPIRNYAPVNGTYQKKIVLSNYLWTICGAISGLQCPPDNDPTSSAQLGSGSTKCSMSYGDGSDSGTLQASLLSSDPSQGIMLTMSGGSPCDQNGRAAFTQITFNCKPTAAYSPIEYSGQPNTDSCGVYYSINTPAACPKERILTVKGIGGGWIAFLVILSLLLAYLLGGFFYKKYKFGSSGIEAIPHIDFWRATFHKIVRFVTCGRYGGAYDKAATADGAGHYSNMQQDPYEGVY